MEAKRWGRPKPAAVAALESALHPVAAVMLYPAALFLGGALAGAVGTSRLYGWAVAALFCIPVVLVHYDRRAVGDRSSWWPFMVFFTGPLAYVPYSFIRRGSEPRAASPIGIVLAGVGTLGVLLAAFLPAVNGPVVFSRTPTTSLLDGPDGWILVGAAAVAAIGVGLAARVNRRWAWLVVICGAVAVCVAIVDGSGSALNFYPYDASGQLDLSADPVRGKPGAGLYAAGVGGALCVVGGLMAALTSWGAVRVVASSDAAVTQYAAAGFGATDEPSAAEYKTCPDCAEQVRAGARVCRFCRHEFAH